MEYLFWGFWELWGFWAYVCKINNEYCVFITTYEYKSLGTKSMYGLSTLWLHNVV